VALLTSLIRADAPTGQIEMLAVTNDTGWRIATPLIGFDIMPNGTGDMVAALFTAHWLQDGEIASALEKAAASVFAVLEATRAMNERELQVVAAQERLVAPTRRFAAEKL
jgi:pyridoxine kinase